MLPVGQDAAEAFYRIVDAAYERRSIAVTSNIHPSGFDTKRRDAPGQGWQGRRSGSAAAIPPC